jgi:hypothetical protein
MGKLTVPPWLPDSPPAHTATLDAILPLTCTDLDRARVLIRSLDRFCPDLRTCWIAVPDSECVTIRREIGGERYRVVPESRIVPELPRINLLRRILRRRPMSGWQVQQLIKLAACDHVGTDWYLTLDADVICLQPWRYGDLIRDDRALGIRYPGPLPQDAAWYQEAARVLKLPPTMGIMHGVTPALLHRGIVHLLARRITDLTVLGRVLGWRAILIREMGWTEYTLYNTFLEARGLYDNYYWVGTGMYANSVWQAEQFETWDPGKGSSYFTVVQSNLKIPVERVWAKVAPHLGSGPVSANE